MHALKAYFDINTTPI